MPPENGAFLHSVCILRGRFEIKVTDVLEFLDTFEEDLPEDNFLETLRDEMPANREPTCGACRTDNDNDAFFCKMCGVRLRDSLLFVPPQVTWADDDTEDIRTFNSIFIKEIAPRLIGKGILLVIYGTNKGAGPWDFACLSIANGVVSWLDVDLTPGSPPPFFGGTPRAPKSASKESKPKPRKLPEL